MMTYPYCTPFTVTQSVALRYMIGQIIRFLEKKNQDKGLHSLREFDYALFFLRSNTYFLSVVTQFVCVMKTVLYFSL